MSSFTLASCAKLYRKENSAVKEAFETAAGGRSLVSEWRDDDADAFGVAERVLSYARVADLDFSDRAPDDFHGCQRQRT